MELSYIAVFVFLVIAMVTRAIATPLLDQSGSGDCSNPSEQELRLRLSQYRSSHEDDIVTSIPAVLVGDGSASSVADEMTDVSNGPNSDFVCPWEWDLSTDSTRFPEHIATVTRCSCDYCRGTPVWPGRPAGRRSRRGRCEVIERSITVLRRAGCENGIYTYIPDRVNVGVGCGCRLRRYHAL